MAHSPSSTMRAWIHSVSGAPSNVLSLSTIDTPILKSPTHVLIRITHAALNPAGSIMMQLFPSFIRTKPCIPELDFAGTVVSAGTAVPESRGLSPGTPVFGSVTVAAHMRGAGGLAEYVAVDADTVVRKPSNLGFEEAAGLAVAGCTALVLVDKAGLKRGDSVLVNGASGGIGHMALQMVKDIVGESGKVVAICSGTNAELVKMLGADEVIDYQANAPVHKYLSKHYSNSRFDCVIDAYGVQELYLGCAAFLAKGRPFVTVGVAFREYTVASMLYSTYLMIKNRLWPHVLGGPPRNYVGVTGVANLKDMERLKSLCEQRKLRVVIDSCWEMEDALKAYGRMLSRHARGKIIVKTQN